MASTAWQAATLRAALGGPQANPARSDRLSEQRRGAKHTRGRTTSGGSGGGGGDNGDNGDNGGSSAEGRGGRAGELTNYVLTSLLAFTAADMLLLLLTAAHCCSLLLTIHAAGGAEKAAGADAHRDAGTRDAAGGAGRAQDPTERRVAWGAHSERTLGAPCPPIVGHTSSASTPHHDGSGPAQAVSTAGPAPGPGRRVVCRPGHYACCLH